MTKHAVFLALSWVLALNVPHPGKPLGPRQTGIVGHFAYGSPLCKHPNPCIAGVLLFRRGVDP